MHKDDIALERWVAWARESWGSFVGYNDSLRLLDIRREDGEVVRLILDASGLARAMRSLETFGSDLRFPTDQAWNALAVSVGHAADEVEDPDDPVTFRVREWTRSSFGDTPRSTRFAWRFGPGHE